MHTRYSITRIILTLLGLLMLLSAIWEVRFRQRTTVIKSIPGIQVELATEFDYDSPHLRTAAWLHRLLGSRAIEFAYMDASQYEEHREILEDYEFLQRLTITARSDRGAIATLPLFSNRLRIHELVLDGFLVSDFSVLRKLKHLEGLDLSRVLLNSNWASLESLSDVKWIALSQLDFLNGKENPKILAIRSDLKRLLPKAVVVLNFSGSRTRSPLYKYGSDVFQGPRS